jgi:deoxyribodipyrimidine photo-lyase
MRTLVWFRGKDLRLSDHAPLRAALSLGEVVPLFVLDPFFFAAERARELPHRIQFLLESLRSLEQNIAAVGSRLLCVPGRSVELLPKLVRDWRVDRVVAQRWVEPFGRARDAEIARQLAVPFELYEGETLRPPGSVLSGGGEPYSVFTPFARAFVRGFAPGAPLPKPQRLPLPPADCRAEFVSVPTLAELEIEDNPRLVAGGERAARTRMQAFLANAARHYDTDRDRMDKDGTSRLSQDLKFGTLSVRTLWTRVLEELNAPKAVAAFCNELLWREFSHDVLWNRPHVLRRPFRPEFEGFPWSRDEPAWRSWVTGRTGYPIVDAAQRQLLAEGFVHNRARMITASFLTKHLMIDYRRGEAHFLKYLTDGDWAQNNAGWQWSAGTGCDAQPYFRIFNPVTQGKRFDPDGEYVKRWVPELRNVPARHVHAPWTLASPPTDYPAPIVEHAWARTRYLQVAQSFLRRDRVR